VASAASQANREWELDRIRRLLYEQECTQLKGRLEEKETEIETIRQEKTRITKVRYRWLDLTRLEGGKANPSCVPN